MNQGAIVVLDSVIGGKTSETGVFLTGLGALVVLLVLAVGAVTLLRSRRG